MISISYLYGYKYGYLTFSDFLMILVSILVFFNFGFFICETILELLYFNLPLFAVVRY